MQQEVRKTVSVVFSDIVGSTALAERLDPESLRQAMTRYFALAKGVHERHGGVVEKFIGDAVVAVFGVPHAHEDDALRAVRAADDLGQAMTELNRELEQELKVTLPLRTGVNTGLVVAGNEHEGHGFVSGDTLNLAARLEQAAAAGEVLLGEATYQLVADAVQAQPIGPSPLRGRAAPVDAYRLLKVASSAPGLSRQLDTPLVGRTNELAILRRALDRAISGQTCELVNVLGDSGVGKSRLLQAFAEQAEQRAVLLHARCPPYGQATTAQVVGDLLAQTTARAPSGGVGWAVDVDELAADPPAVFWAVRQLLQNLALTRPVVVVIDDLHWAEPALLDLVEYLHAFTQGAMLLVVAARRHPLDYRHRETVGRVATTLVLEPLSAAEAAELAVQMHGPGRLEPDTAARIADWAEGNPLFIEELLRSARADADGASTLPLGRLKKPWLPPAVEALIGAELDRLAPQERMVLELASVHGRVFDWASVAALAPAGLRPRVGTVLLTLARRNLIRIADQSPNDAFTFRHGLLCDGAYQAISLQRRAALHMQAAEWLAEVADRSAFEDDEAVGHLEQAYHYLAQLAGEGLPAPTSLDLPVDRLTAGVAPLP